jgi:hypothetical protein
MKACLLAFALGGVFQGSCGAQNALEPCQDELADPYHGAVGQVIDKAVARPASLQLTTFPSFEAESGLRLAGTELYFVEFKSSYWGESQYLARDGSYRMDFSRPKILTKVRHAPLSAGLAQRVERAYAGSIAKAKKSDWMGLDGVIYLFATSNGACAVAWSPKPRTPNVRLVELMARLEKHTAFSVPLDLQRSEKGISRLLQAIENN